MTAGQRNCYIAIEECLNRYSADDVLFAVREHGLTGDCNSHAALVAACLVAIDAIENVERPSTGLTIACQQLREALAAAGETAQKETPI